MEKLLSKKEIAEFLSISTRQVDRFNLSYIMVGARRRYNTSDVLDFFVNHGKTEEKENK